MKLLLLDNYDSFTFNLLHYLKIAGAEVSTVRNNELSRKEMLLESFDGAVISPGPCTPTEAENLMEFVALHAGKKPLLGVCLGMQAIGMHFGWELTKAKLPKHGKSSLIQHFDRGIFQDLQNPLQVGRYHSLIITQSKEDIVLKVEASCENEIMAVSGFSDLIWGVQFHPESILTPSGQDLINNWMKLTRNYAW